MSAKAVEERRLRPVYDALDNYNPKKALQEVDKVLKKHPNTTCAKVLRALALIRLERLVEAVNLIEDVQASLGQYEESTLQAFVHCFKELNQPERICTLYEKAATVRPDESIYSHLFMSYARCCNFKDQQKTALALYRIQPSQPYYMWAVMSVVMQATLNPAMGEKMLLPLAQKMLAKVLEENKGEWKNQQEVELNALVMEKQGRHAAAADLLDSPAARMLLPTSSAMLHIRVLQLRVAAKQWSTVMEQCEQSLAKVECADQWLLWGFLFDSAFALAQECTEEVEKMKFIDDAFDVVKTACEIAPTYRGPYMAHLEFVQRAQKAGLYEKEKHGDGVELILSFSRRFYSRPSCFVDLVKWLNIVGDRSNKVETGISSIVDEAMRKAIENGRKGEDDTDLPTTNAAECWAIVLQERVRRWYGKEIAAGPEERRSRVLRLSRALLHAKNVQQPAATLAALAAEGLYLNYRTDGDSRSLYEALLLLETAARNWQEDHLTRLVLMHIYTLLGIPGRMRQLAEQLDIKMVQKDSLGHLGFHAAEVGGQMHTGSMHYTNLGDFYDLADREISDCLVTAYKNGAFSQIEGVVGMRRKMRKSIMAMAADVANRWISAAFSLKVIDHVVTIMKGDDDPADWEALSDNRDYTIFPPADAQLAEEIKEYSQWAREEMLDLSRTRHLIMRTTANIARGTIEAGRGLMANLTEHLDHCRKTYSVEHAPPPCLANTPPSYLGEWIHGPFLTPILRLLNASLGVIEDENKVDKLLTESELSSLYSSLIGAVSDAINDVPPHNNVLQMSTVMRLASRAAHAIAFCRQLLRIMTLRFVGEKEKNAKKGMKDALVGLMERTKQAGCDLSDQLERANNRVTSNLEDCFPAIDEQFWNVEWAALLLSEKREANSIIGNSWLSAINELQNCLRP